jgi:hypothetical protein
LDRDLFSVSESEIANTASLLTIVGGKVVWADGVFRPLSPPALPAAPSWSPVAAFGGYQQADAAVKSVSKNIAASCGCSSACGVHGHSHDTAYKSSAPVSDLRSFWGALGCACFI